MALARTTEPPFTGRAALLVSQSNPWGNILFAGVFDAVRSLYWQTWRRTGLKLL